MFEGRLATAFNNRLWGVMMEDEKLIELLAGAQHEIWSHWMRYMFTQGHQEHTYAHGETFESNWVMPADKVERWKRQMNTPYADLTVSEKKSDRDQALKLIAALKAQEGDGFDT